MLSELVPWEKAQEFIAEYTNIANGRLLSQHPASPIALSSFIFPKEAFTKICSNANVKSVFFALGFHKDTDLGNCRTGYTAISLGLDTNNNLLTDSADPFWDPLLPSPLNPDGSVADSNITLEDLEEVISFYRENHPIPVEAGLKKTLKGHSFDIDELKKIVDRQETKEIEIILAYHHELSSFNDELGYTWILLGIDTENLRMTTMNHDVYDFCDPCPKKCPSNIDFPYFE